MSLIFIKSPSFLFGTWMTQQLCVWWCNAPHHFHLFLYSCLFPCDVVIFHIKEVKYIFLSLDIGFSYVVPWLTESGRVSVTSLGLGGLQCFHSHCLAITPLLWEEFDQTSLLTPRRGWETSGLTHGQAQSWSADPQTIHRIMSQIDA